jgi:hypothetical protein
MLITRYHRAEKRFYFILEAGILWGNTSKSLRPVDALALMVRPSFMKFFIVDFWTSRISLPTESSSWMRSLALGCLAIQVLFYSLVQHKLTQ